MGIAGNKFGSTGAANVLGSGIAGDVAQLPRAVAGEVVAARLPAFDASGYDKISVRQIKYRSMNGQILIALKKGWTEADESQALVKSIAIALGVGDTPEAIEQSRTLEFAYRKAVWAACVAQGHCGDEPKVGSQRERP